MTEPLTRTPRLAALMLLSAVALSACLAETSQPLPADFVPGAEYDITPEACAAKGGKMTTDGNGLAFCYK